MPNSSNYLNIVGYALNLVVTFAASPLFGFPDNAELSDRYQTIVTPSGGTFAIWGVIFIAQAVFAIAQILEQYRGEKLVQKGVSFWYFTACMFQCAWTFAFGYEVLWLSVIFMAGILASLAMIVLSQSKIDSEPEKRVLDFWLFKFPFSIHCGWIAVAFAVNLNAFVFATEAGAGAQTWWAYLTLVYAILVAAFALLYLNPPDFTIPSVLVWATIGIVSELNEAKPEIEETFGEDVVATFRSITLAICIILGIVTTGYGALRVYKEKKSNDNVRNYEGSEMASNGPV